MAQVVYSVKGGKVSQRVHKDPVEKAQEVLATYEIHKLADGVYSVKAPNSASAYTTDIKNNRCTCPAGENGRSCKHVLACRMLAEQEALAQKEKEEQVLDLLERFASADEERLLRTLTEEWRVKVLKELARRLIALEQALRKAKAEEAEKALERLLE